MNESVPPHHSALIVFALSLLIGFAGTAAGQSANDPAHTRPRDFNIVDFGAVADGQTVNTGAIQKAIDACAAAGGGQVTAPAGVFVTGTVNLRDNVLLYLAAGSTLRGSHSFDDYQTDSSEAFNKLFGVNSRGYSLVFAENARNVGIAGPGTIDGQGDHFMRDDRDATFTRSKRAAGDSWFPSLNYHHQRGIDGQGMRFIWLTRFIDCHNLTIRNVTLTNSEFWTVNLINCDEVSVQGVKLWNYLHVRNTDGIDMMGCRNVDISECDFRNGDDAIVVSNYDYRSHGRDMSNISISNCNFIATTKAVRLWASRGVHENIRVVNCTIRAGNPNDPWYQTAVATIPENHFGNALTPMTGIEIRAAYQGIMRNVLVSNIVMEDVRRPFEIGIDNFSWPRVTKEEYDAVHHESRISDVTISNIMVGHSTAPSSITGLDDNRVKNIFLSNIHIHTEGRPPAAAASDADKKTGPYGLLVKNADGLTIRDFSVICDTPDKRNFVEASAVANAEFSALRGDSGGPTDGYIALRDVKNFALTDLWPSHDAKTTVSLDGDSSEGIYIQTPMPAESLEPLIQVGDAVDATRVFFNGHALR